MKNVNNKTMTILML